jgi:ABC-type amino acid transport substrate-binding protein
MKIRTPMVLLFFVLLSTFHVSAQLDTRIDFTEEELEWVSDNPVIYYSDDVSWEPFVRLTRNNQLEGIAPDFLKLIENKTGLKFEFVKSEKWAQVIDKLKARKISLVLAAIYASERDEFAHFTDNYFSSPLAIVTGKQFSYVKDMSELSGKKIAAPKGYYSVSMIRDNYPDIDIILVDTLEESLSLVNQGKADAYIGYLPVMVYKLKLSQYSNFRIFIFNDFGRLKAIHYWHSYIH